MADSRERRRLKKQIKLEKQQEKSHELRQRVALSSKDPRYEVLPSEQKKPRLGVRIDELELPKHIRIDKHFGSRFSEPMTWCARCADQDGKWSWGETRLWSSSEWEHEIKSTLDQLEGQTWAEIDSYTSDTSHKMHHGQDIATLHGEVIERWIELELDDFEEIFRFRMANRKRAWGVVKMSHFHMIWWDRVHGFYPTK